MNLDDHVWNLASKKLANEASEKELQELNALLAENPVLHSQLRLMSKWWDYGEEKPKSDSSALFGRIQAKIKDMEGTGSSAVVETPSPVKPVKTMQTNYNSTEKLKQHSPFLNSTAMIKNYLKVALRQLRKQKMYTAIKIGGFAFSIAACLLIALYIRDELSFDKSYPNAANVYRLIGDYHDGGLHEKGVDWPSVMGKVIKQDFPEVEKSGRLMPNSLFWGAGSNELKRADQADNTHEDGFAYADQGLIDILNVPMVYGDAKHALTEPLSMVISKSKADKYFPGQNPVGKVMYLNNNKTKPFKIAAVMQDMPNNSHLHDFKFLITLAGVEFWNGEQVTWDANNYHIYMALKPGTNIPAFEKKVSTNILKNYYVPNMTKNGDKRAGRVMDIFSMKVQNIQDINLRHTIMDII